VTPAAAAPLKTLDPAAEAKAREVLRNALAQTATAPAPAAAAAPAAPAAATSAAAKPAAAKAATATAAVKGAPAAAAATMAIPLPKFDLPITKEKWDQLAQLTAAYMADQVTPAEYHQKRAEIIGKP
jgi:plasmid stability protein